MMICECGVPMRWRCDNAETNKTKYKCPICGKLEIIDTVDHLKNPLFDKKTIEKLEENKEKQAKENHKQGARKRWKYQIPKHYNNTRCNTWMVTKWIDGRQRYFGTYKTEEDAKFVVQKLRECEWDKKQLSKIKKLNFQAM